jgi:hypothetical protein
VSNEGIELAVYAPDLTTFLGNLPRRWDPTFLDEHNRDGGGSFKIRSDDQSLIDYPTLLNEGNMVRVTVDGTGPFWWEIANKDNQLVSDGEYAGEWIEVSGPGLRSRLSHAVVYPEYGLVTNPDDRAFNFASKQGSWYAPAQWSAPTVKDPAFAGGSNWAGLAEWPKNVSANWIWNSSSATSPKGDVYFRHEFSLATSKKLKIFASADDLAVFLIDGARVLTISEWSAWKKVFTADIELSAGNHVFAAKGVNTSVSKAGLLYAVIDMTSDPQSDDDITNAMRVISSGTGGLLNAYPAVAPGWNLGQILNTLLDEAVARGTGTIGSLTRGFTNSADSNGVPWSRTWDMVFSLGDSLSNVATKIADGYADVWISGSTLHMAQPRGTDRSVAIGAKDPVIFRDGLSVLGAASKSTAEIANVAVVETNAGLVERVGPAGSLSQFGRRESFISGTNGSESGTAGALIDQLFAKFAQPRRTPTLDITATPGNVPWVDFFVGDWILAPDDSPTSTTLIKRRVVSLSVQEDQAGNPVYAAEIDTIQTTSEERLSRWLLAVENGTKAGGLSGTSSAGNSVAEIVKTGAGTGNPPLPSVPSQANPTVPTSVTATSEIYLDELKVQRGRLNVAWQHDGLDVTGRTLAAVRYEMTYRPTGSSQPWVIATADNTKTGIVAPLRILKADLTTAESYTVAVRAVGVNGRTSDWSSAIDVVMLKDTTAPTQPYFPTTAVTTWLRTVKVTWGGKLTDSGGVVQNDPPSDLDHINVYQSTSSGGAGRTKVGRIEDANGIWVTDKLTAGTAVWFELTAVDKSGNESPYSVARSITPQANVNLEEISNAINAANVAITNIGTSAILDNAILTSKLADNQVLLAKLDQTARDEIAKGQTALSGLATTNSNVSALTTTVNGKNTIVNSTANASGTTGYVTGDRWQKWDTLSTGGKLLASWRYNGSAWLAESIDPVYIPQIDIGSGTFGSLAGSRLTAKSVTATEVLLSRGANMHTDPEIQDLAGWSTNGGLATPALTGGRTGKGSVTLVQNSSQNGSYYGSSGLAAWVARRARVVPGSYYRVGAWVYCSASAPVNTISIYARWWNDTDGTNTLSSAVRYTVAGVATAVPANTWTYVSGIVQCPTAGNYTSLSLGLFKEAGYTTGTTIFSDPSIQPAADANLVVQGSIFAEHVNASSVAGAVGSFIQLNVTQLVATTGNIDTAVIDKLWTDVVQSRKISTQMLEVTGENLLSNGYGEFGNNTNWSLWTYSTQVPTDSGALGSFTLGAGATTTTVLANNQAAIRVDGNTGYMLEGWIKADVANSKTFLEFLENNGVNPTPQYALSDYLVPTTWTKFSVPVKTSPGQTTMQFRMFPNHPNGSVRTATQYLAGLRFRRQITQDVIVDGGIVARHITASEEMWAKTLGAHKINVGELDANNITSDTGFVGSMRTSILTSDVITATMIHATNGITSRHTITGPTIQTAATGRRVKLDTGGVTGYDASGAVVLSQNTSTGDMIMRGNILSRTTNGNSLWMGADMTESGAIGAPQRAGLIFGSTATETSSAALYRDGTYGALRMDSPRSAGAGGVVGGSVLMSSNSGIFGWAYRDADVAGPSVSATQKFYIGVDNNWFIGGGRPANPDDARIQGNSTTGEIFIVRNSGHRMNFASDRSTFLDTSRFDIAGPLYANAKNFRIPHPTQQGMDLIHTATESPVVGVEYWGEGVIGAEGNVQVELPEYFEALVRERNRAVILTAIDNIGLMAASQILDGVFTVSGDPGQRFSWLVKAERADLEFDVVQPTRQAQDAPPAPELPEQPIEQDDTPPYIPENPAAPKPDDTIEPPTDETETVNGTAGTDSATEA